MVLLSFGGSQAQLLWQISGNGIEKPSYLFGTIHLGVDISEFNEPLVSTLEKADVIATEVNTESVTNLGVMQFMFLPDSVSYKDYLTEMEYALVDSVCKLRLGVGLALMQKIKPMWLSISLSIDVKSLKDNDGLNNLSLISLDQQLRDTAFALGKKRDELESAQFQFQLLDSYPLQGQFKMLVESAKADASSPLTASLDTLTIMYRTQNIDQMANAFAQIPDPFWQNEVVNKRNVGMCQKLIELMQNQSVFAAVGAGHLGGQKGLVNLLKEKGFTLTPIKLEINHE
ncbi:MAG: TraB/GumN family protein [Bacteroidetes bacterium]|nr:TraB/GumN family protein [Bacteroidota bacterium]